MLVGLLNFFREGGNWVQPNNSNYSMSMRFRHQVFKSQLLCQKSNFRNNVRLGLTRCRYPLKEIKAFLQSKNCKIAFVKQTFKLRNMP
jgi:hypothetical protein